MEYLLNVMCLQKSLAPTKPKVLSVYLRFVLMPVKVDLRKWGGKNFPYIVAWIGMGITLFILLVLKLRLDILILIGPFIPYLIISLVRIRQELKR